MLNNVLRNTLAQASARARFMSSTRSSTFCGCPFFDSLFLALFISACFSYIFFFYLNLELNFFLLVVVIGAMSHWHSAKCEVWLLGRKQTTHNDKGSGRACVCRYIPDDVCNSETTDIFFQNESSDSVPSCLSDAELDDETIGRAISSPLFTQEREEPADPRQVYHSFEESLLAAQSFFCVSLKNGETRART